MLQHAMQHQDSSKSHCMVLKDGALTQPLEHPLASTRVLDLCQYAAQVLLSDHITFTISGLGDQAVLLCSG
jgi:hypothetical protein